MDSRELQRVLRIFQDGVVSRRQIFDLGGDDHDIRRLLRRRELTRLHPGVYIDHTGRPSRHQREWGAVLALWPAALSHESALGLKSPDGRIHVAVPHARRGAAIGGVRVHRLEAFDQRVDPMRSPLAVRRPDAVIDAASARRRPDDAFTLIAEVLHDGQVDAAHIRAALDARDRVRNRRLLEDILDDLVTGACSVLERGYLHRVERAHGLPRVDRQVRVAWRAAPSCVTANGRLTGWSSSSTVAPTTTVPRPGCAMAAVTCSPWPTVTR